MELLIYFGKQSADEKEIGRLGNFHNENTQICVLVGKYYLGIQTKDEI